MKKVFIYIVFTFFLSRYVIAQTTNISGIINAYASVSAVNVQSVSITTTSGFNPGDRILLIQIKGATIDVSNTISFGTILNYNDAGNYEMLTIDSVSGNSIFFTSPISRTYSISNLVQLVKVPTYNNVIVTGPLACTPWNGFIGGVLAFEASGNITLNANIDVSGNGFLGGARHLGTDLSCSGDTIDYVQPFPFAYASNKGEGIVNAVISEGKGAFANGGGSGNDVNGGGAGGGNYGEGGHGGNIASSGGCPPYTQLNCGGMGGKGLTYSNLQNKIFLGGGGGAGHENDNVGTAGTNGGGIILISGQSIVGNNNFIRADGLDNTTLAGNDGQGGGGAGGAILLNVCSYTSLNISAEGGEGGTDYFTGPDCHGKGGGGGGGIIWSSAPLNNVTTFLNGGLPGVFTNPNSHCYGGSNGATQGQSGAALIGLLMPGSTSLVKTIDTTICSSTPILLDAGTAASYTWSTGSNAQTTNVSATGTYWVQVNSLNSCLAVTDTFHLHITVPSVTHVIKDTSICSNVTYTIDASQANAVSYTWSTGATGPSVNINNGGIYWVDMNIDQCVVRDSAIITVRNPILLTLVNYTICTGQSVNLVPIVSGGSGIYTYNWGNGFSGPSYSATPVADSVYSVSVADASGCYAPISTGNIYVLAPLQVNANGTNICAGDTINLLASASGGAGNYSYTWTPSNSHQNPFVIVPQSNTVYTVSVSDGCTLNNAIDTAQVIITSAPTINLPNSISGCTPVCINFNNISYNLLSNWQWDFGDGSSSTIQKPFHCYTKQGDYNISFSYTTKLGCVNTVSSNSIVTVYATPTAQFSASTFDTDIFNTDIYFYNESLGYTISQWYFGDSNGSNLNNPSHLYVAEGNYPVTLIVHNQQGCTDTVIHEVNIHDVFTFYAPNAFTPNDDIYNEKFLPIGTGWDNSSFKMLIYDRWGNQILSTTNPNQGWDGKVKGQDAQQDVYMWEVELKDIFNKVHSYSGTISVVR